MPFQAKIIMWLLSVAAIFGVLYGSYHYGRYVEALAQSEVQSRAIQEQREVNRLALLAQSTKIINAGVQHDADQNTITSLRVQLGGVRIHLPTRCAVPDAAIAGTDSGRIPGVAVKGVDDYMADAKRAIDDIGQRCAGINIDAIRLNSEIK